MYTYDAWHQNVAFPIGNVDSSSCLLYSQEKSLERFRPPDAQSALLYVLPTFSLRSVYVPGPTNMIPPLPQNKPLDTTTRPNNDVLVAHGVANLVSQMNGNVTFPNKSDMHDLTNVSNTLP